MKKLLKIVIIIMALVAIAIASVIGYTVHKGPELDRESKAFVDDSLPGIFLAWDGNRLHELASLEFQRVNSAEKLAEFFMTAKGKLGNMKTYKEATGQTQVFTRIGGESETTARYRAEIEFEQGQATVELGLIKQQSRWFIQEFNMKSPVFMK